jgi:hypothetical protein
MSKEELLKPIKQKLLPFVAVSYWEHKFQMQRQSELLKRDFSFTNKINNHEYRT